jgi:hypothetical protein
MEAMEAREMMAGDVTANVVDGTLFITEAAGQPNRDNAVMISQIAPGRVRIGSNATTTDGTISKINGADFQDFTFAGNLNIKLGGGSDLVVFSETAPPTFATANIDLAATSPGTLDHGQSKTDDDNLMMFGANIKGSLVVNTGDGNDWVYLGKVTVGNTTINTGAGHDSVEFAGAHIRGNLDIQTYSSINETDADEVYFHPDADLIGPTLIDGNATIRMGGGDDGFYSTDPNVPDSNFTHLGVHTLGSLGVDTGAGNDTAFLRNIRVDTNFSLNMGAGADTLDMRQTKIDGEFGFLPAVTGTMNVQMYSSVTENDADVASFLKIGTLGNMNIWMGAGNDQLTLTDTSSQKDMTLDAGAGNDTVQLTRVLARDNFFASLGDGDDLLNIVDFYELFGSTKIDGGAGTDRLNKTGTFSTTQLTQSNFEWINGHPQPGTLQTAVPVNPGNFSMA